LDDFADELRQKRRGWGVMAFVQTLLRWPRPS
jgi:hypothetical protein